MIWGKGFWFLKFLDLGKIPFIVYEELEKCWFGHGVEYLLHETSSLEM